MYLLHNKHRTFQKSVGAEKQKFWRQRTAIRDQLFSVTGPRVWNSLPATVRHTTSSSRFGKVLKAFLCV